jgi:hypothetical protein
MSEADKLKEDYPREDHDYGLSWIRREGRGRVFYAAHGHSERVYALRPMLEHVLAGVQYAIRTEGDFEYQFADDLTWSGGPGAFLALNEQYTFSYRLKELETRLDPSRFLRLGRGILANVEKIVRVSPMPGGTYLVTLSNDQQLSVSRLQSRVLRDQLLKI